MDVNRPGSHVSHPSSVWFVIEMVGSHVSRVGSGEQKEQTDSEDDDYVDDIELQSTAEAKRGIRRESVSAEQVRSNAVRIQVQMRSISPGKEPRQDLHRPLWIPYMKVIKTARELNVFVNRHGVSWRLAIYDLNVVRYLIVLCKSSQDVSPDNLPSQRRISSSHQLKTILKVFF